MHEVETFIEDNSQGKLAQKCRSGNVLKSHLWEDHEGDAHDDWANYASLLLEENKLIIESEYFLDTISDTCQSVGNRL